MQDDDTGSSGDESSSHGSRPRPAKPPSTILRWAVPQPKFVAPERRKRQASESEGLDAAAPAGESESGDPPKKKAKTTKTIEKVGRKVYL